jgi:hypothetical protein
MSTKPITQVGPWKAIGTATLHIGDFRMDHVGVWVHDDASVTVPFTVVDFKPERSEGAEPCREAGAGH